MTRKTILLLYLSFLAGTISFGQDKLKENTVSVFTGMSCIARQDLIFSPFIHKDISFLNAGFEYSREALIYQNIRLGYSGFAPILANTYEFVVDDESISARPHYLTFIDLDYLIGRPDNSGENRFAFGGLFSANIQTLNYVYGRISSFGYYATLSAGVYGKYNYLISEKSSVSATLQLPVISWFARSPYLVNDDEYIENTSSHSNFNIFMAFLGDGKPVTWNKIQYFDFDLRYAYVLNQRWSIGAAYMFQFIHAGKPRDLLSYCNSIYVTGSFKF